MSFGFAKKPVSKSARKSGDSLSALAKKHGIKLTYVRGGKRYRKTDKVLRSSIRQKAKRR